MESDRYFRTLRRLEEYCRKCMDTHWQEWPSVADMAKRYKVRQEVIEEMIEDSEHNAVTTQPTPAKPLLPVMLADSL